MKIHSITLVTDAWRQTFQGAAGRRDDVAAELRADGSVALSAGATPVRFLRLRFDHPFFADTLFLGDAWERSYGDLQWRGMDPSRYLPWYFFARARGITEGIGVKVNPGALAVWTADPDGATLWLDVRSGSDGVVLDGRTLEAATVVHASYPGVPPFDAACRFCSTLSPAPLLPPFPVYGSNNWYYAYGKSSRTQILADCRTVAGYTEGLENRPFMVVDDGWQIAAGDGPDRTPWREGCAAFPDIPSLPAEMASHGVRPGIWCRPLWNPDPSLPDEWRIGGRGGESLDPSRPDVLDIVARDIRRISDWGFRLIKHDFTTFDIFGRWGFEMSDVPAPRDLVHLADRSRTSAETIASLYRTIRDAAGPGTLVPGMQHHRPPRGRAHASRAHRGRHLRTHLGTHPPHGRERARLPPLPAQPLLRGGSRLRRHPRRYPDGAEPAMGRTRREELDRLLRLRQTRNLHPRRRRRHPRPLRPRLHPGDCGGTAGLAHHHHPRTVEFRRRAPPLPLAGPRRRNARFRRITFSRQVSPWTSTSTPIASS
jgi:hypothetical protein